MATQPNPEQLWSVEEYLRSSWHPDREFVDGRIEERNLGEKDHSILQRYFTFLFTLNRSAWGVEVFPELRTQTEESRFRVPDVLVIRSEDKFERYITHPPLIAIEIVSPDDKLQNLRAKAAEYRRFGIGNIWIIDPATRHAYRYTSRGLEQVTADLTVSRTPIHVELSQLWAELDRA